MSKLIEIGNAARKKEKKIQKKRRKNKEKSVQRQRAGKGHGYAMSSDIFPALRVCVCLCVWGLVSVRLVGVSNLIERQVNKQEASAGLKVKAAKQQKEKSGERKRKENKRKTRKRRSRECPASLCVSVSSLSPWLKTISEINYFGLKF